MKNTTKKIVLSLAVATTLLQAEYIRDNTKEVVKDTEAGLMWQDNIEAKTVTKNWQGAVDYCQDLNFAGYTDWYLPERDELMELYNNKSYLQNVKSSLYWSATAYVSNTDNAWYVYFKNGYDSGYNKTNNKYIRCVRLGGQ